MTYNKRKVEGRKQRLWRGQNGRCHWCQCHMLHWRDIRSDPGKVEAHGIRWVNGMEKIKSMPRTLATIDHLRDRFDSTRGEPPVNKEQRWVLACWQCNADRGKTRQQQQPIEVLHERSRRHPNTIASATHLQAAE